MREIARYRLTGSRDSSVPGAGCVVDPLTTKPVSGPEWHGRNVARYGETVAGQPPDRAYGWDLRIVANVAHWRECRSMLVCTETQHERPASELLAFKRVGRTSVGTTGDVEVLELSLAPRPGYIVPGKDVVPASPR